MAEGEKKLTILGSGRLGILLSGLFARHHFVTLFVRSTSRVEQLRVLKRHPHFPQLLLPPGVILEANLEKAVEDAFCLIFCSPASSLPRLCQDLSLFLPQDVVLCTGTKGITQNQPAFTAVQRSFPHNPTLNLIVNPPFRDHAVTQLIFSFGKRKVPVPLRASRSQYLLVKPPELLEWFSLSGKAFHFFYGFCEHCFGRAAVSAFLLPYLEWVAVLSQRFGLSLSQYLGSPGMGFLLTYLSDSTNTDVQLGRLLASGHELSSALRELPAHSEIPSILTFLLQKTPKHRFLTLCGQILRNPEEAQKTIQEKWLRL